MLLSTYYGPGTLHVFIHLILKTMPLGSYLYYHHFTDEKTTAQILTHLHKSTGAGIEARVWTQAIWPQSCALNIPVLCFLSPFPSVGPHSHYLSQWVPHIGTQGLSLGSWFQGKRAPWAAKRLWGWLTQCVGGVLSAGCTWLVVWPGTPLARLLLLYWPGLSSRICLPGSLG